MPFRIAFWRRPKPAAVPKAMALEERLRNMQERVRLAERGRWERRLRLLVAELRSRGQGQAAINLEEVVDELAGKGR